MADMDRLRANDALKKIKGLKGLGVEHYGNYVSFVKAFPAVILQNGLGQALATELASSGNNNPTEKGHKYLFHHVSQWLGRDDETAPYQNGYNEETGILQRLVAEEQRRYIKARHDAMAYVSWLKKFAVALLIQPEGES